MSSSTTKTVIEWTQIRPTPDPSHGTPLKRSSHGISSLDAQGDSVATRLVLFGGENIARTPISEPGQSLWIAERTEMNDESWKWISPSVVEGSSEPPFRVAHAQATIGRAVYFFGGRAGITMQEKAMNDLWKLELVDGTDSSNPLYAKWTQIVVPSDSPGPEPRSFHKMISVGDGLFVFGGCGANGRLNDLWRFDTVAEKWESLGKSHVLQGRGGANLLELTDEENEANLFIVAGFAGEETNDGHVYRYSASSSSSWEEKGLETLSELRPRSVCASGTLMVGAQKTCLLFGGEVDPSDRGHEGAGNFENDLVLLDGRTGALKETIPAPAGDGKLAWPQQRGWSHAAVATGSGGERFYVFGGLTGNDVSPARLDDLWECHIGD